MPRRHEVERRLRAFREAHPTPAKGVSPQVRAVLRVIHDDPFDPRLNVKSITTRCGISDHNISSYFKFDIGVSIKQYVEYLRLAAACVLLQDAEVSVAEAALAVGYVHLQTFYGAFTRRFGIPPGERRLEPGARLPVALSDDAH